MSRAPPLPAALPALLALMAGCADVPAPDFTVRGAAVVVASGAPFTRDAAFPPRLESTLEVALRYWGGSWAALDGVTVRFEEGSRVACGPDPAATGCFDGDIRVPTRDVAFPYDCVEQTALVHEVGHAVIGDPGHRDPRWMDFEPVREALAGRPAMGSGAAAPCPLYPSVWRHPPAP